MDFLRQLDILDPDKIVFPVIVIGAGGIGNVVAFELAKMGFRDITIYDPDKVEKHNPPNQLLYKESDIGKKKCDALKKTIKEFTCVEIKAKAEFFRNQKLKGIVISGLDSMKSRKEVWSAVCRDFLDVPLYIDGRLACEVIQIHTVKPSQIEDREYYETTLYSDEQASPQSCTARAIVYVGSVIAGLMASQVKKWLVGQKYDREIIFDLVTMTLVLDRVFKND